MLTTIRIVPDEDGVHWRGVGLEDEALVAEIMSAGVPGSPKGFDTRPHDGTLGGFCSMALRRDCQVLVTDA